MTLFEQTRALARAFKAEADRLDREYTATADPRALEGGAFDWDARELRDIYRKLVGIALDVEGR